MSRTANDDTNKRFITEDPPQPAESAAEEPEHAADSLEAEDFEYVIPEKRKKKKKKKRRHSNTPHPTLDESADGYIFSAHAKHRKHHGKHRRHKKKKPLWLRILIIVLCVILGLAVTLTSAYFIMKEIGRRAMHNYESIDISIPLTENEDTGADVIDKGRTIKYGGKTYLFNENMMSVTFIGYVKDTDTEKYMADAIYILAVDSVTGKTSIIGISRDTMADVDVYALDDYIDTEKTQICYAFSYGGKRIKGGENVNKALTKLFFGLPLNNYFAIDLNALEDLNNAVGGVTLTSMISFESKEDGRWIEEGDEITLYGKDVETYVRSRDKTLDGNNNRMDRQQQYIKAFLSSLVPAAKKDLSTVTRLFGVVSDNADTSLDLPKVTYIATTALSKMRSASDIEYNRLSGEMKLGENAEMYLKNEDILATLLKVFYNPI